MQRRTFIFAAVGLIAGCSFRDSAGAEGAPRVDKKIRWFTRNIASPQLQALAIARQWEGKHERTDRRELRNYIGVDPVRVEWCAAFVNRVLSDAGLPGTDSLMARSFLWWGKPVTIPEVEPGDIVVYRRGPTSATGHVGFYARTEQIRGRDYWVIVGGNQGQRVSERRYPARTRQLLSVRRWTT